MLRRLLAVFVIRAAACEGAPPLPPPLQPVADAGHVMAHILEPAADTHWDAVGSVVDSTGTTAFAPQSLEPWDVARNSAFAIADSGSLLMLQPARVTTGNA